MCVQALALALRVKLHEVLPDRENATSERRKCHVRERCGVWGLGNGLGCQRGKRFGVPERENAKSETHFFYETRPLSPLREGATGAPRS